MARVYRKGKPSPGCCWFTEREEAINWDGTNGEEIYQLILLGEEFKSFFIPHGIGYKITHEGYRSLSSRINKFDIERFIDLCQNPKTGRFM